MAGTEGAAQEQPAAKVALDSVEDDDEFEEFECEGACPRRSRALVGSDASARAV